LIEIRTPGGATSTFKFDKLNVMTNDILLNQSFEGLSAGNQISGNEGWSGTSNSTITSGGAQSLKLEDNSTTQAQTASVSFPAVTSLFYEYWVKASSTDDILYMEVSDGLTLAASTALSSSGKFGYYDNSQFVSTDTPYVVDTWYKIALAIDAADKTYDFYVYDRAGTQLLRVNDITLINDSISTVNTIKFKTHSTKQGIYYVDDISLLNAGLYQTRSTFDYLDKLGVNGDWFKNSNDEAGTLAWQESSVMSAYLNMYETTLDTAYLDKFISHADAVLNQRDSARGVTDYKGDSFDAWRNGSRYTLAEKTLADAAANDVLIIKSVRSGDATGGTKVGNDNNSIFVKVTPGTNPGSFKLNVYSQRFGVDTTYDNLNMDHLSPDYALTRVIDDYVVLEDLGGAGVSNPVTMSQAEPLEPKFMHLMVDNAVISVPFARYVDLVYNSSSFPIGATYRNKADIYKTAVKTNLSYFDAYWTDNPADSTEGYFIFPVGSPIWSDGIDEPLNRLAAIGTAYLYINHAEPDAVYATRAAKIANLFKQDLELRSVTIGGISYDYYYWTYWDQDLPGYSGWTSGVSSNTKSFTGYKSIEDVSHADLDLHFAILVYKYGLNVVNTATPVFNLTDMQRFANNLTKKVIQSDGTMSNNVIGNGYYAGYDSGWVQLTQFDPEVYRKMKDFVDQKDYTGIASTLGMSGLMNWAKPSIILEAEALPVVTSAGDSQTNLTNSGITFNNLSSNAVNDYVEYTINIPSPGTYTIYIGNRSATNKAIYQLAIGGTNQGGTVDQYSSPNGFRPSILGNVTFGTSGNKTFRFTVVGKNASSSGYQLAYDYIKLVKH
ncbi:MAG: hypothetical protein K0R28_226, partial [Paenibacillus sp.]|nr:hypothetical protein [Paenibacillus sp.]